MSDDVKFTGQLDQLSRAIIFKGVTTSQLAQIFRPMQAREVTRRLGDLEPVATGMQGNPIYDLAQAAARIVRPQLTPEAIDRYMKTVNHSALPPMVSKLYWEGLRTRERYREETDELWRTEDIVRLLSTVFQAIRATLVLLPDTMRGREDMTEAQFRFVQRLADDAIEDVLARLVTELTKPSRAENRARDFEEVGAL